MSSPAIPSRSPELEFRVLGPLTVSRGGTPLPLGPPKQRQLLAALLARPNAPVAVSALTDALWESEPPRTARKNLQSYTSALRKLLSPDGDDGRLRLDPGGYVLRLDAAESDVLRFEALARTARQALRSGETLRACRMFREALGLWRESPLAGLTAGSPPLRAEADRLLERRLTVYESWAEAELECGGEEAVAGSIADEVAAHPLRERLRAAQITALHRCGRRAEALAAYDDLRQRLSRELGLAPSPALTASYRAALEDGFATAGAPSPPGRPERVLLPAELPDLTGRTAQLAELRRLLGAPGGRQVVVCGPVGIGKTVLAAQAAHTLGERYPDGRVAVRMRAADGSPRAWPGVLAELARFFGLSALPAEGEEAAAHWRAWLARHRVLLLLDDVLDEAAIRPLLPMAGAASVLITSRSRQPGLEPAHCVELPPFTTGEALDLLGAIVGPHRLRTDPGAARRIVAATGLLPLGVRVCGTKLATQRHLPLAEYAERLARPGGPLDELACGGLEVRPRLRHAWRELSEPARRVLRDLSVLPAASFTLEQAMAALRLGPRDTRRALEPLIDCCALAPTGAEVTAHAEVTAQAPESAESYELPRLLQLFAREQDPDGARAAAG
jgi:DNA-binding SARP family transcriptional activator